jgi:aminopeptidase N
LGRTGYGEPRRGVVALLAASALPVAAQVAPASLDGYDLIATNLSIELNVGARSIAARQTTTLRAAVGLRELRFDANALRLASATLDGAPVTWRTEERALVLALPRGLSPGETATLRFEYGGTPARGLVFDAGMVYSTYFSCDWMLCALDRPGDKFVLKVDAAVPAEWRSFVSEPSRPYSAYVQGFGAGSWTEVRERIGETELVFASAHASAAELRSMFAETGRMVEFYRARAGVTFPHATYTQLLVRGAAAQEGAGFAILGDDVVRPVLADPQDDWAIAHELAHQYWGNLLTCESWSEFWLNEGLTTFMVAAWKQQRWGEAQYQREIATATERWTRAREAGWDRPLAFAGVYPDLRTRRAIQYSKGMLLFVELRRTLGEDLFWRGIQAYTRAHAGGVVTSVDLQRAFESEGAQGVGTLFAEWVYEESASLATSTLPAVGDDE